MQHNTFNTMPTGSKYSLPLTLQKQNETYNSNLVPYLQPKNLIYIETNIDVAYQNPTLALPLRR